MFKRFISVILSLSMLLAVFPNVVARADEAGITEISNQYIKVVVNNKNGGYVISTLEGDILKKSDNNAFLTHRGENYDTSFTSFKIGDDEYVFGEQYGFFGSDSSEVVTERDENGNFIKSTQCIGDFEICQNISLVSNDASEQLGTAMITYTVKNNSQIEKEIKSRILIDTQLGEKDYGYYEVPKQKLGQGYEYFEFERTWDSSLDPTIRMPSDYFVRDNPYSASIVGYGVNSVFTEQKPYKMTFAHWANIAGTVFDYVPDETLNFTNNLNDKKTADSAAALYYDIGKIASGTEKSFSTYYGVTANLKNKENKIIINTTAPSKLDFTDDSRTAYKGSEGIENVARVNVNLTNPQYAGKDYKNLAVVVYALGFDTQRQTDGGNWIEYDNNDPIYTDIVDFKSGENKVTYFDFKFTPKERAQLGTFVIKVFDMDEDVNELGYYAEEYCLATTENHIILPGKDQNLPAITLTSLAPDIIYNQDIRYITVTGNGAEFFKSELLDKIYLIGDDGQNYEIPIENLIFEQGDDPSSVTLMLDEYMEPGRYQLHFLWKNGTNEPALDGVPADFTSDAMFIQVSSDIRYANTSYGIVTVQRTDNKGKYKVVPYKNETELQNANINEDDLLLSFRGDIQQDKSNKNFYRLFGKDKNVNINYILNYHGDDLTIEEKTDGTVEVLMDGKITTVGANTTVRNGTAAFRLKGGTEYIIPEYDEHGEVQENGELVGSQDFIELKWDNAFDILTTVGGFLIDMKYGVLGKIQNDDGTKSDIISFGGSLDLSFMTPGGAATARKNSAAGAKWNTKGSVIEYADDESEEGYTFGLNFDEESGEIKSQVAEKDIPPSNKKAKRVEAGATIHDVLYGGKDPGFVGINMDAHVTMPQIVKFLPNKIEGELSINTIGDYEVGVDAEVETASLSMKLSLVVKESPSGAPIPDKLYFTIGGFEPGLNIDSLGVVWVTGGGGGIDKLYDTIYGKDGVPPLTLMLHVEFDITKILTGNADLELSLRSIKLSFDDLSLKMLKDAKFVDGGKIAVGWYPNFSMNFSGGVNFAQIMKGRLTITAAAGKDTADFVQFVLTVSIGLPKFIPIVGGMELASAELGGGSEKMWGSVEVLSLIKVGFTYYWGGDIEFTHGSSSGGENFASLSSADDEGERRTKLMYNRMLEPMEVGTDSETGKTQFASIGGNLSYSAGSRAVSDFEERVKNAKGVNQSDAQLMSLENAQTEIFTNSERTSHLVNFGENCDYILSVSRADGSELSADELKKHMSVTKGGAAYELRYYTAPDRDASDDEKRSALKNANVNVSQNAAYIAIPKSDTSESMLIEFTDNNAYDISAIKVNPISTLTSYNAAVNGNNLHVVWNGENISDSAKIIIRVTDGNDESGIILNEQEISAKALSADVAIPDRLSSGEYSVVVTLTDENTTYQSYNAGTVSIVNNKAPNAADSVTIENCGDDKLKINVTASETNFDGYLVEVYENGTLADTGLYFEKGEEIIVGGRYEMPLLNEDGTPTGQTIPVGYTPGKEYTAKVRLCNIAKDSEGNEIYHSSAYKTSPSVILKESTQPNVVISYDKNESAIKVTSDVPISGEMYINHATEDGQWYNFTDKKTEILQTVELSDGDYTVEFHAEDNDGDHAIVSQIISIDTTAPVIMLASPMSGDCFSGDSITITATADKDAEYSFKINGNTVSPQESDIFASGMMQCTLPLSEMKNNAKIKLEIAAKDSAGNETVKNLVLTNEKISEIISIGISSTDKPITAGKLTLSEGENATVKVLGKTASGETIDVTDMEATSLEVVGGTSAALEGTKISAGLAGQTMLRAQVSLGGNDFLYDGIVVDVKDTGLIYTALESVVAQAEQITNTGYTDESWNNLQNAIAGAKQIMTAEGVTQNDIDNAATFVADAIAALQIKNDDKIYYTVTFSTNGGTAVESQSIESGQKVVKPENPTKEGFTFEGWYSDESLSVPYDFNESVTKAFTLYAKWTEKQIDPDEPELSYTALESIVAQAEQIKSTGYTAKSWNNLQEAIAAAKQIMTADGVTQSDIDNAVIAVENAIAALVKKSTGSGGGGGSGVAYYTVAFNTNGGTAIENQRLKSGEKAEKPENPTKEGFTFEGWYSDKNLSIPYDFNEGVIKTFTLYAKWAKKQTEPDNPIEPDAPEWKNPFTDVSENDWFYNNVKYANENGLMSGMTDTGFAPNEPLTRGMLVTVLYRAEGEPAVNKSITFADVDANAYYASAVVWAQQNGIVNGVTENAFAPDDNITREQIAAIMHRYAKYKGYDVSVGENTNILSYTDFDEISEYAIEAIQYAVGSGMMKGKTETTINPVDNATRAEIAAILQRFIEANK